MFDNGLNIDHLKHTNAVIQGFDQSEQRSLGKSTIKICFGDIEDFNEFLMHPSLYSSTNHGCIRMPLSLHISPVGQISSTRRTKDDNCR